MADPMSQLRGYVHQTISPDRAERQQAEQFLSSVENQPGFPVLVMDLIAASAQSQAPEDAAIAQAASVFFKNTVKRCWEPEEDRLRIADADKKVVKGRMVEYMCNMPPAVQRQMSEALSIISTHDFPDQWQELLPELVSKFSLENFHVTNGVLVAANSIMKRFRWVVKSDKVMLELTYCLQQLQAPLLALFQAISDQVFIISGDPTGSGHPDAYRLLMPMMAALRTISRIFFSLNWLDLPEYFEDHMGEWMGPFLKFLSYSNKMLEDPDEEDEPGPIEKLQTAIIENVSLYAEKYEEEFQTYLQGFAETVWGLLTRVGQQTKFDSLSSTGIRFLNTVVSKPQYSHLFAGALAQFLEQIIVPNLLLRESDEELFEDNPTEWIQKDMEGNDTDTRRRCAIDLVRGMSKHFEAETTTLCGTHIMTLLQQYSTDPANNWKAKDAALCLLVAVSVRASTASAGVSQINAAVDINDMVAQHIIPELGGDVNTLPLIRADCLKLLATFRNQLPIETMRKVVPLVINHLAAQSQVVVSYAANCVERFLTVKENNVPRFGRTELQPLLQVLFQNLFVILSRTDESFENEYVMKTIMRCLSVAKEDVVPLTGDLLGKFNEALERVCKNPRNPQFNHYLFESTAVLVNSACSMNPALTDQFEALLFPPFQEVLRLDVAEFSPYVFQILAQLLEFRADGVSAPYRALFPLLLAPSNWERKANCPALSRLLKAYLIQGVNEVLPYLEAVLGVFQKLLALKSTETSAFSLLTAVITRIPIESLAKYLPTIFQLLMMRLQQHKTQSFCYNVVVAICLIAAKHGGVVAVEQGLETVQAGITSNIITSVWIKTVEATPPTKASDAKVCCLGIIRMITESTVVQSDEACWSVLLGSLVSVLDPKTAVKVEEGDEEAAFNAIDSVASDGDSFSKLHFTGGNKDEDLFPEIPDAPTHACRTLAALCAASPGVYATRAGNFLSPEKVTALQAHLARAGVALS